MKNDWKARLTTWVMVKPSRSAWRLMASIQRRSTWKVMRSVSWVASLV
jgi:hypothetical protein